MKWTTPNFALLNFALALVWIGLAYAIGREFRVLAQRNAFNVPLLHLDHVYFEKPLYIEKAELVRSRLARIASDHLPLVAKFGWP